MGTIGRATRRSVLHGLAAAAALACAPLPGRAADPIGIVVAENVYADMAEAIGGDGVRVTSILANPDQDPHLFEASPATARALAAARIVLWTGAGYDPWMDRLAAATASPGRRQIVVADLVGAHDGDNPHLWYGPAAMPAAARAVAEALAAADPAHAAGYRRRHEAYDRQLATLGDRVATMRTRFAGRPVTATEPVFGLMATALGLEMRNEAFQLAIMNGTEPSAAQIAAFERGLREHRVAALLYNVQTSGPLTERLKAIAARAGVPVVGVSETRPAGLTYPAWMLKQLDALARALAGGPA